MTLARIRDLSKTYGGVRALEGVDLEIAPGEVHALCGENGAGKSTLIKVLAGVVAPDTGQITIGGQPLTLGHVHASQAAGIAVMHQESTAFPHLNAIDNLFVGREQTRWRGWLLDRAAMRRHTRAALERLGESLDIDMPVGQLPLAQQQMVALARALSRNARLLIMDEPTASLSARETTALLKILRQLRDDGVSILFVSHRLEEIFEIADRVTVLRDGHLVATRRTADIDVPRLIQLMVGRDADELTARPFTKNVSERVVLEVQHLTRRDAFQDVSLSIRAGEIVGLAGLIGAGRTEVARAIFGIDSYDSGQVLVNGQVLPGGTVRTAIAAGIAMVPEDRQHQGLVLPMTVGENLSLAVLPQLRRGGLIARRRESELIVRQLRDLQVKAASPGVPAETLSGGNQQKLVLGKWLASQPELLILDEPTRGIDVGAKAQVHRLIRQLAEQGMATLLISSEMIELLSLSHRILVLREGKVAGTLPGETATQERILELALPDAKGVAAS